MCARILYIYIYIYMYGMCVCTLYIYIYICLACCTWAASPAAWGLLLCVRMCVHDIYIYTYIYMCVRARVHQQHADNKHSAHFLQVAHIETQRPGRTKLPLRMLTSGLCQASGHLSSRLGLRFCASNTGWNDHRQFIICLVTSFVRTLPRASVGSPRDHISNNHLTITFLLQFTQWHPSTKIVALLCQARQFRQIHGSIFSQSGYGS